MSIETLKADLRSNIETLGTLETPAEIAAHLRNTLWPFLESMVAELEEMDGVIGDIVNNAEDILQVETARLFAGVIAGGLALVEVLSQRVQPSETKLLAAIAEFRKLAKEAGGTLEEITVQEDEEEAEDEEEDGEDDEAEDEPGNDNEGAKP